MVAEKITQALAEKIHALGFISRCGAMVQEIRRDNGSIPSAIVVPFTGQNKPVMMAPDHKETGVSWFEVSASRVLRQTTNTMMLQNEWRLVMWLNGTRIAYDSLQNAEISAMQAVVKAKFQIDDTTPLRGVTVKYMGNEGDGPAILSRWAFDEPENLLTLPPYRVAAHRFQITYIMATNCAPQVATTAAAC